IVYFDVMANDTGGNKAALYSLDNGLAAPTTTNPSDLLTQDKARTEARGGDYSFNGAHIWISADGKVGYDSSTLNAAFKAQLDSLSAGQFLTDSFTYAIKLPDGTLSWSNVTIQIGGVNDNAVITIGAGDAASGTVTA